jgi:hypothetical protein
MSADARPNDNFVFHQMLVPFALPNIITPYPKRESQSDDDMGLAQWASNSPHQFAIPSTVIVEQELTVDLDARKFAL